MELKEFVKVGCDIYKVPKASVAEEDDGKPVRTIKNKQVIMIINKRVLTRKYDSFFWGKLARKIN